MQIIEYLEEEKIKSVISEKNRARLSSIEILKSIDSTNTYLLLQAKLNSTIKSGHVLFAEEQTNGRGRQGKIWFSPFGANIYCSLLWYFSPAHTAISSLALAIAVAVSSALKRYGVTHGIQLKWPNDIYYAERKLAGILIEAVPSRQKEYPVVIGIGVNLQFPKQHPVKETAIALAEILNGDIVRNRFAGLLLDELLTALTLYTEQGFLPFLPAWKEHDMLAGKLIVVRTPHKEISGRVEGVNHDGELIVCDVNGNMQTFFYGDISVRHQSC